MRQRLLGLALFLAALSLVPLWVRSPATDPAVNPSADPPAKASDFLVIGWGQPNTREHVGVLAKHFRHIEVDLMLDRRGVLVGAHDPEKLALVHDGSLPNPLTLTQLLSLPFERVFLDMKDTLFERRHADGPPDAATAEHAEHAVASAFDAAVASGRREDVYVMVYWATDAMVARARERNAQLMLQGYPRNDAETLALVRSASRYGLRHVCVPLARATDPVLEASRRLGVRHIPFTFFQEDWSKARYQRLFEEHLAGLILPPSGQRRFLDLLAEDRTAR
jgi:hypothetical protein